MRGPAIKDDLREFCCMTYKMHHKKMSFVQMAAHCNISETSFRDIIKAEQAIATNDWLTIVSMLDKKHRGNDNLLFSAKRHGWDFEELCAEARKHVKAEIENAKAQVDEQLQIPMDVKTEEPKPINVDEITSRLDAIITLLQENKAAIENATHTIPSNINSSMTSEFESFIKKLNTGFIKVTTRRY